MITRDGVIQYSDIACEDYCRLADEEILELQDQMNCNILDAEDNGETWLDAETPSDGTITIIEEFEFWERFGDVETV